MKKLIILSTTILLAFGQYVAAQPPKIQEILQRLPDKVIPYKGEKHDLRDKGATGVYHADGKLDDRLYTNVQLTEWRNACEHPAESPESFWRCDRLENGCASVCYPGGRNPGSDAGGCHGLRLERYHTGNAIRNNIRCQGNSLQA